MTAFFSTLLARLFGPRTPTPKIMLKQLSSNASGVLLLDTRVVPGQTYKVYLASDPGDGGPTAGTVKVQHRARGELEASRTAYDAAGNEISITAGAEAVGAEFEVVAHDELLRLSGSGLGDTKPVVYGITPIAR